MTTFKLNTLNSPWLIGFEDLFDQLHRMEQTDNYPPHNIVKIDDDHFTVELAVAGFSESDLELEVKDNILTVSGSRDDKRLYAHKGVSTRKFARTFTLNEHVKVIGANLANGILSIDLVREIPEAARPKKIKIGSATESKKTFLSE